MHILGKIPAREIPGADEVLEGFVAQMDSGNFCRCWPALTYDTEKHETRIGFFMEWVSLPSLEDQAEFTAHTDQLMGREAMFSRAGNSFDEESLRWLRTGKQPKVQKPN